MEMIFKFKEKIINSFLIGQAGLSVKADDILTWRIKKT
jgi:hypothetical protein